MSLGISYRVPVFPSDVLFGITYNTRTHETGGPMAKLNSGRRLRAYLALARLNRSYHLIVCRLEELQELRIFSPNRLPELRGLTQEMQTETNFYLLDEIMAIEKGEWQRFGKVRNARDKRSKK